MLSLTNAFLLLILTPCLALQPNPKLHLLAIYGHFRHLLESSIAPGVDLAVNHINDLVKQGVYLNFSIEVDHRSIVCKPYPQTTPALGAEVFWNTEMELAGFIGPPCSDQALGLADLAAVWNLPLISGLSSSSILNDKSRYRTVTRTGFLSGDSAKATTELMKAFGWSHCSILALDHPRWTVFSNAIASSFRELNYTFKSELINPFDIRKDVQDMATISRIIFLAVDGDTLRSIMLNAYDLNLLNGEYAFINIIPFRDVDIFGNDSWERGDGRDYQAKQAYEALMTIRVFEPTSSVYKDFEKEVILRREMNYNITMDHDQSSHIFLASAFYDVMILYSLAVNETLAEGGDVYDGHAVTHRMWNRTFEGLYGQVVINENGDRDSEYTLWDMTNTENGTFEIVGNFYVTATGLRYTPTPNRTILWPGGATSPPLDSPFCGFFNENPECEDKGISSLVIAGITGLSIVLVGTLIIFLVYRKIKLDTEILRMSWKISWSDLIFPEQTKSGNSRFSGSFVSALSERGNIVNNPKQVFATIAHYKGRLVMVKRIEKTKVDLTRAELKDFNNMRQVEHNNLARFVGACVDIPNVCVVIEYCPKGSLQDILGNDSLKLDAMFKDSLIMDIIRGLHYLHNSVIGVHGRLTSSNCVVDSRFVLKLTDFGLPRFRKSDIVSHEDDAMIKKQKLLWKAPEGLHNPSVEPTQEGDIYSVGIILQEIVTRNPPYEEVRQIMDIDDILMKIKEKSDPPFRPKVAPNSCRPEIHAVMTSCWEQQPEIRPSTAWLLSTMKKLNKNFSGGSILDNLLNRMEQYATNLEALVEERTAAFLEEKKRSETLLYEVLPRSVAEQLKRGEAVNPTSYDSVTIYFSDIVGFTTLSADSTPMQVVALLNDLYTCFDGIIGHYDVYKVETIGDAYMVVSGLPISNGKLHAREIAAMSLALIREVSTFRICHRPEEKLKLRVGIHSGSCVAGVVGLKMPRYCLFGDTVNTASRMESTGEPMKIHVSEKTKQILDEFKCFQTTLRGKVELKGKGSYLTYWLLSMDV
ncbi:atrial natriuretic peptide receptor 1-like [Lytechinus pictus]|uniref:atrial natriuretic peptide receptor 1-like n=1 Tax=Lytechinus pictus TaxID=7653 RepID=UPI0030BA0E4F